MTDIQQLIQTNPARTNEIFAKLAGTSATAIKARERLFAELKAELDRQAEFEERHLFPVLRKHEATKDMVAEALNDSRQTRELVAEIERTPKDGAAFGARVAELRDVFQRHLRDDGKEFLPAVMKALSDEEAGTVGTIGDETTEATPARRADGDERRPEDVLAGAARQGAEIVKAGIDLAQQGAQMARMATGAGAGTVERDRAAQGMIAPEETQGTARKADTTSAGRSMVALLNEQARHAMQATMAVGRARTLAEIARVQSDFIGGSVQRMEQFNERYIALIRGWRGFAALPPARR